MVADARFSKVPSDRVEVRGVDSQTGALVWRAVWTGGEVWIDARCVMDMPEALEPLNLNFGHAVGHVMVDHEGALLRASDFVDDREHLESVLEIFALLAAAADGGVA